MKKIDLAYYAGIFDGEGCIQIVKRNNMDTKTGLQYVLHCRVVNTNEWLIRSMKMAFGGNIHDQLPRKAHHKMAWEWEVLARQAKAFLLLVYPYIRLKRPEADIALKFQGQRTHNEGRRGLTDEQWAVQEAEYLLLKNLKGRKTVRP